MFFQIFPLAVFKHRLTHDLEMVDLYAERSTKPLQLSVGICLPQSVKIHVRDCQSTIIEYDYTLEATYKTGNIFYFNRVHGDVFRLLITLLVL